MIDSTVFPKPSVSFQLTLKDQRFYLSLHNEDVVARVSKFILSAFKFILQLGKGFKTWRCYSLSGHSRLFEIIVPQNVLRT